MKNLLYDTLEPLGYPIFQQGTLAEDEAYPESFFTFWNNSADGTEFYDNDEHAYVWDFDLNFYSTDALLVDTMLLEAKRRLKQVGFIATGKGYDVASDEPTHIGRGINIFKFENRRN